MTDKTELLALAGEIERADGPSRELDRSIFYSLQDELTGDPSHCPHYTASIDAALTLVPEGWTADARRYPDGTGNAILSQWEPPCRTEKAINAATPALALCAAALFSKAGAA